MKIGEEKEVEIKIHKKQDGKIHKKRDVKIDSKAISTRTKNNARVMRKVAESKITDNIEGGENIEDAVSVPRHGFPYEILPLHPVLSGSLQSSCYYSASISTIPHFLINSDFSNSLYW